MAVHFLSIQGSYTSVEIALFKDNRVIETVVPHDVKASSHLVPYIDDLLKKHSLSLNDLNFIAIDKGPGAFTSLRVSVATVNGIAFAHTMPLIGIDGLDCLVLQVLGEAQHSMADGKMLCLLNAYNNDVYFGLYDFDGNLIAKGCKNIQALLTQLQKEYSEQQIFVTGNGVLLHQDLLSAHLPQVIIHSPLACVCSATTIGLTALERWNQGEQRSIYKIEPLYLKTQMFTPQKK
ncbi:MAG: tRNA (adenosine(37)-N6)-threonylcarbamoyltransferase complex dimerization subunit type 1 TsaB [Candidatus Babeliales bacterium]